MISLAMAGHSDCMKAQIEAIRAHMLKLGELHGLNDPKVLRASRELDALILSYYRTQRQIKPQRG